jgi:hypothetical protein
MVQSPSLEAGCLARLVNNSAYIELKYLIPQTTENEINGFFFIRNAEGNRHFGKHEHRWEGNTEVNLKYMRCEIVNWARVTQNTGHKTQENLD